MTTPATTPTAYGTTYGGSAPEIYERHFVPTIGRPFATDLVAAAKLAPGQRVLDVGCGTGVVTRLATEKVGPRGRVAGADVTAAMLDVARVASAGVEPPIAWYETAAEAMPFADGSFDVVLSQFALQFMQDKHAALREMRRVLVPKGGAFVSVPAPVPFFDVMHDAIAKQVDRETAAFVHLVFALNDPEAFATMMRDAGFGDVNVARHSKELQLPAPEAFLWQYIGCTPIAPAVAAVDERRRQALQQQVVDGWRPWTRGDGMTYRQEILLATGRA